MNQTENKKITSSDKGSISVDNIMIGIRRFGWLCVVLAMLFGGFAYVKEQVNYVPIYTSEATFTVNTENNSSISGVSVYSFYYNAATANQLSDTFPYILNSGLIQNAICEDLDLDMEYLPVTIVADAVDGSNMFTLKVKAQDPQFAYDVLVSAIENYPTIAKYAVGNIKIEMITSPMIPTEPSNTNDYLNAVIKAMGVGAALGGLIIVLYVITHNTIRTKNDLKANLGATVLGVVPRVWFKKHNKDIDRSVLTTNDKIDDGFTSSIRVIKNVIKNSLKHGEKIIIGTSTAPGEGKTTVTTNLAIAMAEHGRKVLLVDGDVRRLSVSPLLGIKPEEMNFVVETDDYKIAYIEQYKIYLLLFDAPEKGGFKYVNADFIKGVFDSVRHKFDIILVDTPPCGLVSDALFFAQVADAAYYVVLQDAVRTSKIQSGFNNLMGTDVKILGCILNGAAAVHSSYGYGNYGYGRYSYGRNRYGKYGYGRYGYYNRYGKYGYGKYGYGRYGYGNSKKNDEGKE